MSFVLQAWRDSSAEMKAAAAGSIVAVAGSLVALRYTVMGSGGKTSAKIEYKEVGGDGGAAGSGGRVLIIGAGGFIGKEVIKQLVEDKVNLPEINSFRLTCNVIEIQRQLCFEIGLGFRV
jgi:hypothetical protein